MTQLENATVVLTGATGGFGQQLTRQLLAAGSRLILSDRHQPTLHQQAQLIQQEIKSGEILACFEADLSNREGCEILFNQVKSLEVPIDILINNAGLAVYGRLDETPPEKWETLMEVNLLAPMRLSSLFVGDMISRRQGHIVNISSVAGWSGKAGLTHYCASKFGLRGFSEGLLDEVKSYNVKVTAVYPFFSRTPILDAEKYGTLATNYQGLPEAWLTDPKQVMKATLRGIQSNQLHVFPDSPANLIHLLKRYTPFLLDKISFLAAKKLVKNPKV
ncbi:MULTISPECIES: SDR family NAD(P)-dependent oxidoreductase [Limnospira]|uniref:Short-chain dehydrogenase/reductase n=1 Tax=Limnospira indica PCC 8005 TaxID=376219 RepID=A0A9P1KGU8_9CYAN|nr:SDR family NAD(P)-dependent oxidoreductase [Limnospira indica]CDM96693.1 putative short-chain dehydrogenase/reductase [Limnospira indica PCC 8005]